MKFGVGQSVPRVEDKRLLTGGGRYTDDYVMEGMAAAFFLRSPHAHARIKSINAERARLSPGVVAIFTGADVAASGLDKIPCPGMNMVSLKRVDGSPAFNPPREVITADRVRHVGDIVAMVIAERLNQAKDAAELIKVDYEPLPSVTDPSLASQAGAPAVWDECADNVAYLQKVGNAAAVDAAFANAAHVVSYTWRNTRIAQSPMEPRSALGSYNNHDGRYTLISGTQIPHDTCRWIASFILKVPANRVRLISPDMGGAFGMRATVYPEMPLVLWAAKMVGRPVKWTGDRSEAFLSDDHGRDASFKVELALDAAGIFLGLRVRSACALGAYFSAFAPFPTFTNMGRLPASTVRRRSAPRLRAR